MRVIMIVRGLSSFLLFYFYTSLYAVSYMYPGAAAELLSQSFILYIHQQTLTTLQVYEYTMSTGRLQKIPLQGTGISISPDGKKICCIDKGRIRIYDREICKAYSLIPDTPLYNIRAISWIDHESCYCNAQQYGYFGIFKISLAGFVTPILANNEADYLYPQKVKDLLFVVKRIKIKQSYRYQIVMVPFQEQSTEVVDTADIFFSKEGDIDIQDVAVCFDNNLGTRREHILLHSGSSPIAFLSMVSKQKGFFVRCSLPLDIESRVVSFSYHMLYRSDNAWQACFLFTFVLPRSLLFGQDRLYESLLPLLPRYYNNKVYYTNITTFPHIGVHMYDLCTNIIAPIKYLEEDCFAPYACGNKLFHGTMRDNSKISIEYVRIY